MHDEGKYKIQPDGTLEIIGLGRADSGMYTCIADNGVGSPALKQVQLDVSGKRLVDSLTTRWRAVPLTELIH